MAIDLSTLQRMREAQQGQPGDEGVGRKRYIQTGEDDTFADMLKNAVDSVDEMKKTADQNVQNFVAGEEENVHKVMISLRKSQLSFELMLQMRNKVIETYRELSRMQI